MFATLEWHAMTQAHTCIMQCLYRYTRSRNEDEEIIHLPTIGIVNVQHGALYFFPATRSVVFLRRPYADACILVCSGTADQGTRPPAAELTSLGSPDLLRAQCDAPGMIDRRPG